MTAPEPDDTRPDPADSGVGDPHRPDVPDDIDAAFASIVADWAASGAPRWPDEVPDPDDAPGREHPSTGLGTATPLGGQRRPQVSPGVGRVREAVQQDGERAGRGAPGQCSQGDLGELDADLGHGRHRVTPKTANS